MDLSVGSGCVSSGGGGGRAHGWRKTATRGRDPTLTTLALRFSIFFTLYALLFHLKPQLFPLKSQMFNRSTLVALLAVTSAVSALPSWKAGSEAKAVLMDRRSGKPVTDVEVLKRQDDVPDIVEFLKTCPGGPGSDKLDMADNCVYNNEGNNGEGYYEVFDLLEGDHFRDSCGNAAGTSTREITASHTFTQSYSISVSTEFNFGPISGGLNEKVEHSSSQSEASAYKITTEPGRQATLVSKQRIQPVTGSVDLNYGNTQYGHYYWNFGPVYANTLNGDPILEEREANCDEEINVS